MANTIIQKIGLFRCAPTGDPLVDYSAFVSKASVAEQRQTITLKPPLSTAEETEAATTIKRMLTIEFRSSTAASSLRAVLREVINSDDSLLDFELVENDTVVSSDNPRFSGTAMLPTLDGVPNVGALREQTVTLPVTIWNPPDVTP